jgi:hypothetical protein
MSEELETLNIEPRRSPSQFTALSGVPECNSTNPSTAPPVCSIYRAHPRLIMAWSPINPTAMKYKKAVPASEIEDAHEPCMMQFHPSGSCNTRNSAQPPDKQLLRTPSAAALRPMSMPRTRIGVSDRPLPALCSWARPHRRMRTANRCAQH